MAIRILRLIIVTVFLFFQIFQLKGVSIPIDKEDEILGFYNMELKGAPYGYEEGTLSIEKKRGRLESKVELAGVVFRATKTVITRNEVVIDIYIEGIPMNIDLQYTDSKLTGKITSTNLEIEVYAEKAGELAESLFGMYDIKLKGAPYGYEEGTLTIEDKGSRTESRIELGGATFRATKTEIKEDGALIDVYIEGIPMKLDLQYEDSKLTGKITSTDMNFDVYATKIKESAQEILGTYNMNVEGAPYGYEKGVLTISDVDGKVQTEVKVAETVFRAMKTEVNGNNVLIMIFIEGLQMDMNLNYEDSKLTGTVSSTDMNLKVRAEKI